MAEVENIEELEKEYLNLFVNKTERTQDEAYKSLSMKDLKEPYSQADMFRTHCDMLISFAQDGKAKAKPSREATHKVEPEQPDPLIDYQ